jgi:anti-sigma factor (TIGR02949 family)
MSSNYENNCGWALEHIEAFLDDDLSAGELKRFQQHVDRCDTCARELAFATRVVGELRALPTHTAPESVMEAVNAPDTAPAGSFMERMMDRIGAAMGEAWSLARRPAMATMIVLVLATGVFVVTQHQRQPRVSEAEIEEATQETFLAFAYIGKYSRMTGHIVRDEMINEVVEPVKRVMVETRILETKPQPERSDT